MNYLEYSPSEKFREIVLNYWCFEIVANNNLEFPLQHDTLPDNSVSIVLIQQPFYRGVRLLGPHTRKFQDTIVPDSIYLGIRLLPWLTFSPGLFDKKEILNDTADASEFVSKYFNDMIQVPLSSDKSILKDLERNLSYLLIGVEIVQDDVVKFICLELAEGKPIKSITAQLPYSIRVIQKKFKTITGLTMQQYASNLRQRKLWEDVLNEKEEKLDLIYAHNFYDQAHFINDFKKKMSRTHTDFEAYLKKINISLS